MQSALPEAARRFASPKDHAACRDLIRHHSRSFFAASLLLPPRVRAPAYGLYGFCRISDDAVDREGGGHAAIASLSNRLARIWDGAPADHPADRVLADVAFAHAIPREVFDALLEGLSWDVEGRRYACLSDLLDYAARVAGTVGVMMALVMGRRSEAAMARACDLGVAMQITNIVRDVGEDARAGRLYLPADWLVEEGLDPDEWLARPMMDDRLRRVLARLLAQADALYARAAAGTTLLPMDCRPAIHAARLSYAEIGREAERMGLDVLDTRARISTGRRLTLLAQACLAALGPREPAHWPALNQVGFLVDAGAGATSALRDHPGPSVAARAWWDVTSRAVRVIEIFERLERSEQVGR